MTVLDLVIQTLSGTSFDLRVSPYETVMSVKARIQTHEGIPISQQHLVFRNCELKDDYCLNDYAIQNGATLKLVLAMRGGPINTKRVSVDDETASNAAYETATSAADFLDSEFLFDQFSDGMNGAENANSASANQQNSKLALVLFSDGDQLSIFRVVDRSDDSPSSESGETEEQANEYDDEPLRRTATAAEFSKHSRPKSNQSSSESDCETRTGNQTSLSMARSGSIPPSTTSTRPSQCAYCSRVPAQQQSLMTAKTTHKSDRRISTHLPTCPFRNSTEELKRFKEDEDLRVTMRALRSKMAGLRLNREKLKANLVEDKSDSQKGKPLASARKSARPLQSPKVATPAVLPTTTSRAVATTVSANETVSKIAAPKDAANKALTPAKLPVATHAKAGPAAPAAPPIKGRLTPLRTVAEQQDASAVAMATEDIAVEASRILSSLKRRHQTLEPIGVTRLRSGAQHSQPVRVRSAVKSNDVAKDPKTPAVTTATDQGSSHQRVSSSTRLPPLATPATSKQPERQPSAKRGVAMATNATPGTMVTPLFADSGAIASLNASIKIADVFSALQPTEKPSPASNTKQRCSLCGRKTGLATSYMCRCGLTFCALHRYAEAHNCTFDYKSEGRRTLQQQNPLVAAPKLPKI